MADLPICRDLGAAATKAQLAEDFETALLLTRAKFLIAEFKVALETLADNGFVTAKTALAKAETYQ